MDTDGTDTGSENNVSYTGTGIGNPSNETLTAIMNVYLNFLDVTLAQPTQTNRMLQSTTHTNSNYQTMKMKRSSTTSPFALGREHFAFRDDSRTWLDEEHPMSI